MDGAAPSTSGCAMPLHLKRLEKALDMKVLLDEYSKCSYFVDSDGSENGFDSDMKLDEDDDFKDSDMGENPLINIECNDIERSWLADILQEECLLEHSSPAEELNLLMKLHIKRKKIAAHASAELLEQNMYYGTGLLSNFDKYPENKKTQRSVKRKREEENKKQAVEVQNDGHGEHSDFDFEQLDQSLIDEDAIKVEPQARPHKGDSSKKNQKKKFKDEESKKKWEDMMYNRRRKSFSNMVKKEVGKQQRAKVNRHKEALLQNKKIAMACQKVQRNKALQSARVVKELQWRMKRLARENLAYWKRSKRVDREIRRKLEKEAEEQRKIDYELVEAKRQQRKLNFLITQTELYAHFMSKKLGDSSPEEQLRILNQLDEEKIPRLAAIDDYNCDVMKARAIRNAQDAFQSERARTKQFDLQDNEERRTLDADDGEFGQPSIFKGTLKAYQLRGMNWLANLYDQGISGILADEMGLGKTVQSIAFLSHLAEVQDLWGPFLVICPASTLHNWQQEFAKFVSEFKVVPYWGNPTDRKILRQFWNQDSLHTKESGFHVVITSYQIVISDVKYFNRIKWQYMVLDEAQAIKSTSSMRWKTLLGFNCRNRLLLSGTPIQNSMAELWALLHFIMPTLFDSHEEFNEWFSKDIESHAENKTGIDEKHLSRLHMILKPFMLRRIKKDVENELSDKIEIMVYCPLTTRQKLLYMALKQKIHIEDLLHYTVGGGDSHSVDKNFTSNLMNLVMQFRKVCNHPELFERRDAKSPIYLQPQSYTIPFMVYDINIPKTMHFKLKEKFLFTKEYIHENITNSMSLFRFALSLKLSSQELYEIFMGNVLERWKCGFDFEKRTNRDYIRYNTSETKTDFSLLVNYALKLQMAEVAGSLILQNLLFTWGNAASKVIYAHLEHSYHSMPETVEHRNIRIKNKNSNLQNTNTEIKLEEIPYIERVSQIFECEPTSFPQFLFCATPKVTTQHPALYCYSRRAAYDYKRHVDDWSWNALNYYWQKSSGEELTKKKTLKLSLPPGPVDILRPRAGWSNITIPDKETLVTDSGKLFVLDGLLKNLKENGHRVLIYSQMTKMIDLLEEYMWHRHHKYMRLDGSSKISERRDMVADFQARADIFVFLLSTRAGGLGINLTAADTVIFYDSDWNPTVDQQAMDRAHRLGQTKQVTVYRLICKGSIEERILQRAREKSEIQNLVISGGSFKPETLKPKEVVSLLLDDEEIEMKYRQKAEERKAIEDMRELDRKRKYANAQKAAASSAALQLASANAEAAKPMKIKIEEGVDDQLLSVDSVMSSPHSETSADVNNSDDFTDNSLLDVDTWETPTKIFGSYSPSMKMRNIPRGSTKRGRPRGSRRIPPLETGSTTPEPTTSSTTPPSIGVGSGLGYEPPTAWQTMPSLPSAGSCSSMRRGPGRPRLKPGGPPANVGARGLYKPRKPAKPLPVPLPGDANTSTSYSFFNITPKEQE
ncbi:chromatin-remodeling ATPase INO80 [Atheta coriaria]|uniref:chromatin-remodeling ATPase INO80 n=1 Tax=Dalotia coriaria TaxID=877792 RepID=UPI0031F4606D